MFMTVPPPHLSGKSFRADHFTGGSREGTLLIVLLWVRLMLQLHVPEHITLFGSFLLFISCSSD